MVQFNNILASVREQVVPTSSERKKLDEAIKELQILSRQATSNLPFKTHMLHLGSTSRDTWLRGDVDIDIFIQFPRSTSKQDLEKYGLEIGHKILPNGHEEYADHPYVKGTFNGFKIDIVPCYAATSAIDLISAVDRTPLHGAYLSDQLTEELSTEIRLLKQFFKGCGVYGSDLKTQGASGYLSELLIILFGSFTNTIEEISKWIVPIRLDPNGTSEHFFESPLTFIDPIDPSRNVAAVLSSTNLSLIQHYSRELLSRPRIELFYPHSMEPITNEELQAHIANRGTSPIAIIFHTPDIVEDELHPQLQKSLSGIADLLTRHGFNIVRCDAFSESNSIFFFELSSIEIPSIEHHDGPPLSSQPHASAFLDKYTKTDVYGPFIDNDHYVVERFREFDNAVAFLKSEAIFTARIGPDIGDSLKNHYDVLAESELLTLTPDFGIHLHNYFNPTL